MKNPPKKNSGSKSGRKERRRAALNHSLQPATPLTVNIYHYRKMFRLTTALGRSIFLLLFITLLAVATLKIPRSGITDGISNKFMEYAGTHLTDDVGIFHDRVALQGESAGVFEGGDKKVGGSEHWIAFDESDDEDDHPTVTAAPVLTTASAQAPSPTSSIRRDFAKFEAPHEDFSRMLSTQEREVLKGVKVRSGRDERIKRLYDLRGEKDWRDFIESLDDDVWSS